jgi:hypothetical protein
LSSQVPPFSKNKSSPFALEQSLEKARNACLFKSFRKKKPRRFEQKSQFSSKAHSRPRLLSQFSRADLVRMHCYPAHKLRKRLGYIHPEEMANAANDRCHAL